MIVVMDMVNDNYSCWIDVSVKGRQADFDGINVNFVIGSCKLGADNVMAGSWCGCYYSSECYCYIADTNHRQRTSIF